MCRLLAVLSSRETSAFPALCDTDKSLWRQSFAQPRQRQEDGWGLAWYPARASRPRRFPSAGSLPREQARFRAAARARGVAVMAHIRRASNPRVLPAGRLRGRRNVQPFSFGRWTFAHNGSIPYPDETARRLGAFRKRIRGVNDSEVLFWLVMRGVLNGQSPGAAIRAARRVLWGVHRAAARRAKKPRNRAPRPAVHGGLNIVLTDGRRLWAYAEAPPGRRRSSSLCSPNWPYSTLAFLPGPGRLWVASEPLWSGAAWRPVRSGELLEARFNPEPRAGAVSWTKKAL